MWRIAFCRKVNFLDVGCGFGGLTGKNGALVHVSFAMFANADDAPPFATAVALGALFPDKLTLALEIRPKVTEYVRLRIEALRSEHPGQVRLLLCFAN